MLGRKWESESLIWNPESAVFFSQGILEPPIFLPVCNPWNKSNENKRINLWNASRYDTMKNELEQAKTDLTKKDSNMNDMKNQLQDTHTQIVSKCRFIE